MVHVSRYQDHTPSSSYSGLDQSLFPFRQEKQSESVSVAQLRREVKNQFKEMNRLDQKIRAALVSGDADRALFLSNQLSRIVAEGESRVERLVDGLFTLSTQLRKQSIALEHSNANLGIKVQILESALRDERGWR